MILICSFLDSLQTNHIYVVYNMKVIYVISELFKIYDHDYSLEHCTEFEPNRNYSEFFKNRIMVMSTEKKLLDNYITFYTGDCIHKLESLIEKIKVTIKKIKKN